MKILQKIQPYAALMRWDKPIGFFLLLWPTLWALWIASAGRPQISILLIFTAGVFMMRSAGCIINDITDRHIDGQVTRTKDRPLVTKRISITTAITLFFVLCLISLCLVLRLNRLCLYLALVGLGFTVLYPFLKRMTHLPQLGLGFAFAMGIPMAFAAVKNTIPGIAWLLFFGGIIWPIIYDTMYAMVDRPDDITIGVKSTAILFAGSDKLIIGILQIIFLGTMILVGGELALGAPYALGLIVTSVLFSYQQYLIKDRAPSRCFLAFLNNQWVGLVMFVGIASSFVI